MNTISTATSAYANQSLPIKTARDSEYEIFARITRELKMVGQKQPYDFPALVQVIHDNRRLWSTLAADIATPGNALSKELRIRLLYLAEFTRLHSSKVLAGTAQIDILIDINTSIMRGLVQEAPSI